ncbi:MAG: hypothetical protein GTO55_08995 [Armatimonadetes bacterium]|nr:hypothetical protein [Armatimonadota bacterium]NIM24384.1 hypothetical protein [Armatimonadota bacterium]NIM68253.1 hypothetical protein [Armatimonadota bacterium]NIM75154.1 hypothetical protein [Armatimonadota bacterium]NIN06458.1 hypothetical protein [Armatimonadota bacterium]
MPYSKGIIQVRDAIRELDENLADRLEGVWREAESRVHTHLTDEGGVQRGQEHSTAIEEHLSAVVPDEWKECAQDSAPWGNDKNCCAHSLFCLSAAAALHDVGRVPGVARPSDEDHGDASARWIRENWQALKLEEAEARVIADITQVHDHGRIRDLGNHPRTIGSHALDIRLLASLLILADDLHDYSSRLIATLPEVERQGARSRTMGFSIQDGVIYFDALPHHREDIAALQDRLDWMNSTHLAQAGPVLNHHGLPSRVAHNVDSARLVARAQEQADEERGFLGHDYFGKDDAAWFKGRETKIDELYNQVILGGRVSLLRGDSGVGKSSLVCAGLMPALDHSQFPTARVRADRLDVVVSIMRSCWEQLMPDTSAPDEWQVLPCLEKIAKQHIAKTAVIIIIDQFEDVARVISSVSPDFTHALSKVHAGHLPNLHVLLVYRSDAQALLDRFLEEIRGPRQSLPETYLLSLSREQAEEALRAGFERARLLVSEEPVEGRTLMEMMLDDLSTESEKVADDDAVYPPYLQMVGFTLARQAREKQVNVITLDAYKTMRGARKIISEYLLNRLKDLKDIREDAETILFHLSSEVGRAAALSPSEIASQAGLSVGRVEEVIQMLVKDRMVRPIGGGQ